MQTATSTYDSETIEFKNNGVVVVRNVISGEETDILRQEVDRILDSSSGLSHIISYRSFPWKENLPERIDPISPYSKFFQTLNGDERITGRIKNFIGNNDITWLKDKLVFKAPGQTGYEPHQDQAWWTGFGKLSVTCLVCIDAADEVNGGLSFLLNAHHRLLTNMNEPRFLGSSDLKQFQNNSWYLPAVNAGDLVFFHGLTIHKSGPNLSKMWRRAYFVSYCI